jgi:hypothetical protein
MTGTYANGQISITIRSVVIRSKYGQRTGQALLESQEA